MIVGSGARFAICADCGRPASKFAHLHGKVICLCRAGWEHLGGK